MHTILTLNSISPKGLDILPPDRYRLGADIDNPDAIVLRSHNLHDAVFGDRLKCVGRAGAGVNNIPVSVLSEKGIPVFNTPGANANAVKELVLAGILLSARNLPAALDFVSGLEGDDEALHKAVESGKKRFRGVELPGRTLGVIGLGAIGVKVANAAYALGMKVIGYDPKITVERAWQLSAGVADARSIEEVIAKSDFLTLHVPLTDSTRGLLSPQRLAKARDGLVVLNFARDGIVEPEVVLEGLAQGRLSYYVCDFPNPAFVGHERIIALPHLGASTVEAEENCAIMVVQQLRDYLENGNIVNSVNFPEAVLPRTEGYRLCIANANVPNMLGQISSTLARFELNILDMLNKSKGEIAYTVVDVDKPIPAEVITKVRGIEGVLNVRSL